MKAGKTTRRTGQKRAVREPSPDVDQARPADTAAAVDDAVVVPFPAPAPAAAESSEQRCVALDADCTARSAERLKSSLLEHLAASEPVNIDVSMVDRIDTACLQLLTAFARDRQRAGRAVAWCGRNDVFAQAIELLGLTAVLGAAGITWGSHGT